MVSGERVIFILFSFPSRHDFILVSILTPSPRSPAAHCG
jgi:hypothetical protein